VNARVERHVDRLTDRIMLTLVSTLVRAYNLRLLPDSVQRIRQVVEEALREAAIAGKLDALHPPEPQRPDQSMIDTRPYPRRDGKPHPPPPPLPKPKK
jgi:hypothetical protein